MSIGWGELIRMHDERDTIQVTCPRLPARKQAGADVVAIKKH
jgi:hypothetical protein